MGLIAKSPVMQNAKKHTIVKYKLVFLIIIFVTTKGFCQYGSDLFEKVSEFVESERKANNIPSVVVGITDKDKIIYLNSFGKGEKDDLYLIGSNSKSFTALAILILQENKSLDIDKPVREYLTWFKYLNSEHSDKITVRDLLNHTSGIPRKLGMYEPNKKAEIQEFFSNLLEQVPKTNKIGQFEYSNLNYQLLGLIIEKTSGKKYSEFLKDEILKPLNLNKTFSTQKESEQHGFIPSYQYVLYYPGITKKINYDDYAVSSGFISSTASDMCRYLRALMNVNDSTQDGIISKNISDQLFKPRTDIGSLYGMGWVIQNWEEYKRFRHDGATQSFSSDMLIIPELEIGIVIMSNVNNSPSTNEMADGILRILTNKERIEFSKTNFYLRNSLPLFAVCVLIVLFFRLKKWIRLKFPVGIKKSFLPNIWLIFGIVFGLFWIIYVPFAFDTPILAIIDYEPNSGYSLIVLTIGIIISSLIGYFNKTKSTLPNKELS